MEESKEMIKKERNEVLPPTTQQEALEVLVRAIEIAQSRGAFTLFESAEIVSALSLFQKS